MPNPAPLLPPSSLLVAVTGGPGTSKTRLMAELAAAQLARGQRVEGVLSIAGNRASPHQGASEYWLRFIGSEVELPWAMRDDALTPPYFFEPGTAKKVQLWAERLSHLPPPPLLLLDEFGKFELRGLGLMPVWPLLVAASPHVVVLTVRDDLVPGLEELLGRKFDLCVPAQAPDALARLQRACEDFGEWTRIGLIGGAAGSMEMSVGSMLHAAKIPGRGLMMCSLQGAMMTFAGFGLAQPGRVVWVPFISAGLKALSPAGSRVRPMMAIAAQGLLYGVTVQALGWNIFAVTLGGVFIGAWAALQGILLQYLLLGEDLVRAYDSTVLWVAERWGINAPSLPALMGAWALFCAVFAGSIVAMAWKLKAPPPALKRIIEREQAGAPASAPRARSRWREFAHWQFWLPLLVVSSVLLAGGRPWENVAWLALRFVAVGFVLLTVVSLLRPARWAEMLRKRGWWGPALALSSALSRRGGDKPKSGAGNGPA